jgi:hypothetical protein
MLQWEAYTLSLYKWPCNFRRRRRSRRRRRPESASRVQCCIARVEHSNVRRQKIINHRDRSIVHMIQKIPQRQKIRAKTRSAGRALTFSKSTIVRQSTSVPSKKRASLAFCGSSCSIASTRNFFCAWLYLINHEAEMRQG